MSQHSPAPWKIAARFRGVPDQIADAAGQEVASLYATDGADEPSPLPVEANAALIAAAPEVLAALKSLLARCEYRPPRAAGGTWGPMLDTQGHAEREALAAAHNAIAKAEGTQS